MALGGAPNVWPHALTNVFGQSADELSFSTVHVKPPSLVSTRSFSVLKTTTWLGARGSIASDCTFCRISLGRPVVAMVENVPPPSVDFRRPRLPGLYLPAHTVLVAQSTLTTWKSPVRPSSEFT